MLIGSLETIRPSRTVHVLFVNQSTDQTSPSLSSGVDRQTDRQTLSDSKALPNPVPLFAVGHGNGAILGRAKDESQPGSSVTPHGELETRSNPTPQSTKGLAHRDGG
ncbi:hypothetical protein LIA77_00226 [Sarocladium implicatum]|nr:hypothetical protein LIA77_00226 [Sarocladium implicatum]